MCIGLPMKVKEVHPGYAVCEYKDEVHKIDTLLVSEVSVDDWVLVFLEAAREIIDENTANQIANAHQALELALHGETNFDHLFQDLIDKENNR